MWAVLERFRPKPDGDVLLDASYEERDISRRYAFAVMTVGAAAAVLSLIFWKPMGLIGASGFLIAGLVMLVPVHSRVTARFHEYCLLSTQLWGEDWVTMRIEYGWIEHSSWDGDRLNLWLNKSRHWELPETLGMVIPAEHHQAASRILWERRGKSREDLERGTSSTEA